MRLYHEVNVCTRLKIILMLIQEIFLPSMSAFYL